MGVKVLLLLPLESVRLWLAKLPFLCSELLDRDLERFFLGLSLAMDLDRGLPILGSISVARRLAGGMPASPESLRSNRAVGEGELERLLAGEIRPLCLMLRNVLKNGLLQEPLRL